MNIYLFILVLVLIIGITFKGKQFNKDYLSREDTAIIKGYFILLIFYSHFMGYYDNSLFFDGIIWSNRVFLGQLVVTMFLFYSGYGVFESYKKKKNYLDNFIKNRIVKTFIHMDLIILIFFIMRLLMGKKYTIFNVILGFLGIKNFGNSNWYIFDILVLYSVTYASFRVFKNDKLKLTSVTLLTMLFIFGLSLYKGAYWYNTIICYPLGLIYSYNKDKIEKFIFNNKKYLLTLIINIILFILVKKFANTTFVLYEVLSILFVGLVLLLNMKFKLKSRILKWFGDNLFFEYMLQRIPMIILIKLKIFSPYVVFILSFIIMICLIIIFDRLFKKFDKLVFG